MSNLIFGHIAEHLKRSGWLAGLVVDEDLHMYIYDHIYKTIGDEEGDIGHKKYWTSGVYLLG